MDVGHLFRYADLIVVEVVRLLSVFSVFVDVVLIGETEYVPHVPYVKIEDFVRATACYNLLTEYFMLEEEIPSSGWGLYKTCISFVFTASAMASY